MSLPLKKTLLIANPASCSGKGAGAALQATELLRGRIGDDNFNVVLTTNARHAIALAASAKGFHTVLALGGDGVINEVVNGLMRLSSEERPALGIIPVGSGNDYARTLGVSSDVERACNQLMHAAPCCVDVGCVNGHWFVETLSFGLDAAIAIDTIERRKHTKRTGTLLYVESGINQLLHHLHLHRFAASLDGGAWQTGQAIMFAVQLGPTYGGGFKICPAARIDDGLFDVCIAHGPVGILRASTTFLRAKGGHHTGLKEIEMKRATHLQVKFDEAPPAQVDGEPLVASTFDIRLEPGALRVLMPEPSYATC